MKTYYSSLACLELEENEREQGKQAETDCEITHDGSAVF